MLYLRLGMLIILYHIIRQFYYSMMVITIYLGKCISSSLSRVCSLCIVCWINYVNWRLLHSYSNKEQLTIHHALISAISNCENMEWISNLLELNSTDNLRRSAWWCVGVVTVTGVLVTLLLSHPSLYLLTPVPAGWEYNQVKFSSREWTYTITFRKLLIDRLDGWWMKNEDI